MLPRKNAPGKVIRRSTFVRYRWVGAPRLTPGIWAPARLQVGAVILLGKKHIGIEESKTDHHQEIQQPVPGGLSTEKFLGSSGQVADPQRFGVDKEAGHNGREGQAATGRRSAGSCLPYLLSGAGRLSRAWTGGCQPCVRDTSPGYCAVPAGQTRSHR